MTTTENSPVTGNRTPFLDDIVSAPSQPWWFGHFAAVQSPEMTNYEYPVVRVAEAIHVMVIVASRDGQPVELGPAIGQLLSGFVGLLDGDLGRLDRGTCDQWARVMAERVGYCLDHAADA
jgi:hypothetical protein